jgi:hypothetical protein
MNDEIFRRNLSCLEEIDPSLAVRIAQAKPSPRIGFTLSKTGKPVALALREGEKRSLHSLFDPEKEGQRMADSQPGEGFFLFFGLGCAYHIFPCLRKPALSRLVIIETDLGFLKAVFGEVDFTRLLKDSRVSLLANPARAELEHFLFEEYLPALAGDLRTVFLRPRFEDEKVFFEDRLEVVKNCIEDISGDFSVQSRFGKRWFLNSLRNLSFAEESRPLPSLCAAQKLVAVTAAGPSLEDAIPAIKAHGKEAFLIATDTSLPPLLARGIEPGLVISLDCQHISYNHFLCGLPEKIPLVLDLASPPVLAGLTKNVSFFTSGHPFSRYVNSFWRAFPVCDTSGGNVTHAAASLAVSLGARQILLYGADFSYPDGKTYAREAYVYPHFRSRETRLQSIESFFTHFLFRAETHALWKDQRVKYTSPSLSGYRRRLEQSFSGFTAKPLVPGAFWGEVITLEGSLHQERTSPPVRTSVSSRQFLETYRQNLLALQPPASPASLFFQKLPQPEKILWTTLLPVCAAFFKASREENLSAAQLMENSRQWAVEAVEKTLGRRC